MEDGHNVKNLKKKIAVMCAVCVTTTSVMAMPKNAEASFWESFSRWMNNCRRNNGGDNCRRDNGGDNCRRNNRRNNQRSSH